MRTYTILTFAFALLLVTSCGVPEFQEDQTTILQNTVREQSLRYRVQVEETEVRDDSLQKVIGIVSKDQVLQLLSQTRKVYRHYAQTSDQVEFYQKFKVVDSSLKGWILRTHVEVIPHRQPEPPKKKEPTPPKEKKPTPPKDKVRKIIVELSSNKLFYYEDGALVRSWNIGSARAGKKQPKGSFRILSKQTCPIYYGNGKIKPIRGCSKRNPLGSKALWFVGTLYGLHGTNAPHLIAANTTARQRRVSAGCIRNNNAHIDWLYERVRVGDQVVLR
ncbi:MAG: L,D-transpeptidase [Myxococcota bacterium]